MSAEELNALSNRYADPAEEAAVAAGNAARGRGSLTRPEFLAICEWKTRGRPRRFYERNTPALIAEASRLALTETHEELRLHVLTALEGVAWSVASAILHLAHADDYPILDWRALESLGVDAPSSYTFSFWWTYVEFCRGLAVGLDVTMRELDRALWQLSKESS